MSRNLTDANRQLFRRPADEHFADMKAIMADAQRSMTNAEEVEADLSSDKLFVSLEDGKPALSLPDNRVAHFSNHSMAQMVGPWVTGLGMSAAEKLAKAEPELLVKALNALMRPADDDAYDPRKQLLLERRTREVEPKGKGKKKSSEEEYLVLRSINGRDYARIWDYDILTEVNEWLTSSGMIPALPTINTDAQRSNIMGNNKPALFRGDADSFCFFYEKDKPKGDDGFGGLRLGMLFRNSEVGKGAFGWSTFVFRDMCANFLIWGAENVTRKRMIHRGRKASRKGWREFIEDVREMHEKLAENRQPMLDVFAQAQAKPYVGDGTPTDKNKELAVARLNKDHKVPKKRAAGVVDAALMDLNGGDLSVWSVANGVTWDAKETPHADSLYNGGLLAEELILAGTKG